MLVTSSVSSSSKHNLDRSSDAIGQSWSWNKNWHLIGLIASHEVILQLIKSKCFPALYYGMEACPLRKSQYNSINYVNNSTFRKIFNTRSQEVVGVCLEMCNCLPAEKAIAIRKRNFLNKFCVSNNELCKVFTDRAKKELATLLADILVKFS